MDFSKDLIRQSENEAAFFDKEYADADKKHAKENYLIPEDIVRQLIQPSQPPKGYLEYAGSLLGDIKNKKMLDYGAGDGWTAISFAKGGAKVFAIDISKVGIELIKKKAVANGVSENITAEVQNCYKTNFPENTFEIIFGGGVLHHLEIIKAGQEISRILNPDGVAVFLEPVRETKIMDHIKKIVLFLLRRNASEVTEEEDPLTKKRIALLRPYFRHINIRYFNVLSSASPLIKSRTLKNFLLSADDILIKYVPGFYKLGRAAVIEVKNPTVGKSES